MRRSHIALAIVTLFSVSAATHAVPVVPGQTLLAVQESKPVGGIVVQTRQSPNLTPLIRGALTSNVIRGDTSNPYGGYTFTYQLQADVASTVPVTALTIINYNGFSTDMSFNRGPETVAPFVLDRDFAGGVVGFRFVLDPQSILAPGTISSLLVVQTNASDWDYSIANVSANGQTAPIDSLGPISYPEPTALIWLFAGCALRRAR